MRPSVSKTPSPYKRGRPPLPESFQCSFTSLSDVSHSSTTLSCLFKKPPYESHLIFVSIPLRHQPTMSDFRKLLNRHMPPLVLHLSIVSLVSTFYSLNFFKVLFDFAFLKRKFPLFDFTVLSWRPQFQQVHRWTLKFVPTPNRLSPL